MLTSTHRRWAAPIAKVNLSQSAPITEMMSEILTLEGCDTDQDNTKSALAPQYAKFHNEVIVNYVKEFYRTALGADLSVGELIWFGWTMIVDESKGDRYHYHPDSGVVSAFYLNDTTSDLVFVDPRANAGRWYTAQIENQHYDSHRIRPCAGDLLIFPSYLPHYAEGGGNGTRIVLPCDYDFVGWSE